MNTQPPEDDSNNSGHQNKLPAIYLWVPLWVAFLALGWVMQEKYYPDTPDIPFESVSEPKSIIGVNENVSVLTSDKRGHYVFIGYINDKQVKFLLDTGATSVAVPEHLAGYLGLSKGQQYYSHTANGKAISYNALIKKIKVGSIEQEDVRGSILPGMDGDSILLGMSFLKDLEIIQKGGEISLVQKKLKE